MLSDVLENRGQRLAHTLLIQDNSRLGDDSTVDVRQLLRRSTTASELALTGILSCIESVLGLMEGSVLGTKATLEPATDGLAVMACAKTMTGLVLTVVTGVTVAT